MSRLSGNIKNQSCQQQQRRRLQQRQNMKVHTLFLRIITTTATGEHAAMMTTPLLELGIRRHRCSCCRCRRCCSCVSRLIRSYDLCRRDTTATVLSLSFSAWLSVPVLSFLSSGITSLAVAVFAVVCAPGSCRCCR